MAAPRLLQIFRHKVGSNPGQDEVAYHETDDQFYISISRSKSEKVLYISAGGLHLDILCPFVLWHLLLPACIGMRNRCGCYATS